MTKALSLGTIPYDRVAALRDGRVTVPGYALSFPNIGPGEIHHQTFATGELAFGEVSPSNLAKAIDKGDNTYIGLPIFLSRAFRHGQIYVPADGRIQKPEDLAGARIGTFDFYGTTAILQRGILQDEHGIDLKGVKWVVGPIDGPEDYANPPPAALSEHFHIETPAAGDSLTAMMARGELDAILTLRAPKAFSAGQGMVRLFPDYVAVEQGYYSRTGQFPVMHIAVLRRDLAEADPALPRALYEAFLKAKDLNQEQMKLTLFYYTSLPWIEAAVAQSVEALGPDFWAYGLKDGGKALETFLRYCHEQHLTSRLIGLDEMFPIAVE